MTTIIEQVEAAKKEISRWPLWMRDMAIMACAAPPKAMPEIERDCQSQIDAMAEEMDSLRAEIAASQAREAKLREALEVTRTDLVMRAEMDPDDGCAVLNVSNGVLRQIDEALALPHDDTALKAYVAAEREECARTIEWLRSTLDSRSEQAEGHVLAMAAQSIRNRA